MKVYNKAKPKYGSNVASWLYGIAELNTDYDAWAYSHKTEKTRRKYFLKQFNGSKDNFKILPICKN